MPIADRSDQGSAGVFEALHQIGVAIGSVLEPLGLARLVVEQARAILSADMVGLWSFDERSETLRVLHFENARVPSPGTDARPGEGVVGRTFTQREPIVVLDCAKWEDALPLATQDCHSTAIVAVPLLVGGRAIGVVGVGFPEPHQATPAAVETLTSLAAEVAPALEAARLYEAARAELAERGRAEEAVRFQAQLLGAVEHALVALDLDGTIRYWNRAAETLYGWRAEQVTGRNVRELLVPEDQAQRGHDIMTRLESGQSWSGEFEARRRDGTVFPALVSDSPVRDLDGRAIGLISASIDLSELVDARRRLEESEQRFRSMFEFHPDAVFAWDRAGRTTLANRACERLSGYTVEEILAAPRAYATPAEVERATALFEAALRGEPQQFETVIAHKDGHDVDIWTTHIPIVVEGQVTGVFGIARDVTETHKASEALRASEQRFRAVWEHAADAMVLSDADGVIQLVNPAFCTLYGLGADELIGHDFSLILQSTEPAAAERWHRERFAALEPPKTFRNLVRRSDGEECTVECRAEFVSQNGERVGLITIIRDITERERADHERETLLQELATAQQRVHVLLARVLKPEVHQAQSERRAELDARAALLSPRELGVLRQLALGKTNPEIGRALGLSSKAARNRVADVLAKLGVADRTQAAVLAVELGLSVSPT